MWAFFRVITLSKCVGIDRGSLSFSGLTLLGERQPIIISFYEDFGQLLVVRSGSLISYIKLYQCLNVIGCVGLFQFLMVYQNCDVEVYQSSGWYPFLIG